MPVSNSNSVIPRADLVTTMDRSSLESGPREQSCDANDRHFATEHLLTSLKGRTISGSLVTILAQGAQFVLMLVSTVILARLLSPSDFGLVAMVMTIMGFLTIFNDAGLSTATMQRERITHAQVSNLFWTNIGLGASTTLLLGALAPVIAWFYREPRLIRMTLALCATFILTSAAVQHLALLKRQMQFKTVGKIQVASAGAGVLTGITMALLKCGYWSLVGMQLAKPLMTLFLAVSLSRWRPQWPRREGGTRSLLHFGLHLTMSSFLWSLARGSDGLLLGRVYGPTALGLYSRAGALLMRPIELLLPTLGFVLVPALSRLQNDPQRYRRVVLQIYDIVAVASFLVTGLLFALAQPVTLLFLGEKWAEAAPIFAGFTLVALYYPIGSVASWLLMSQGRGKDFLRVSAIVSFVTPVFFIVGMPFGPVGVASSYSAFCLLIALPVGYFIAGREGPVSTRDLWARFWIHLPLWITVCVVTFLTRSLVLKFSPWKQIAICASVGLAAGILFISVYAPARRAALNLVRAMRESMHLGNGHLKEECEHPSH
jgi:O-antigen/teichoic acid export membrane protein